MKSKTPRFLIVSLVCFSLLCVLVFSTLAVQMNSRGAEAAGMAERGVIGTVAGDIQRMDLYAQKGYQIPMDIPAPVRAACARLVAAGYTGQLVK